MIRTSIINNIKEIVKQETIAQNVSDIDIFVWGDKVYNVSKTSIILIKDTICETEDENNANCLHKLSIEFQVLASGEAGVSKTRDILAQIVLQSMREFERTHKKRVYLKNSSLEVEQRDTVYMQNTIEFDVLYYTDRFNF
jgi:hypothetical protein